MRDSGWGLNHLGFSRFSLVTFPHVGWKMSRPLIPCAKCASLTTDLYRDRDFSGQGFPRDAVLHCRCCGYRLHGAIAIAYTERVLKEKEKAAKELRLGQRRKAAEEARRKEEQRQLEQSQRSCESLCAWEGCEKEARSTSKYCSRSCSNKNARARHRKRLRCA